MHKYKSLLFLLLGLWTAQSFAQNNSGQEFWFTFPPNTGIAVGTYTLYIISNYCIDNGKIEMPANGYTDEFVVQPGQYTQVVIPVNLPTGGTSHHLIPNRIEDKGIKITAEFPFAVYAVSYAENSTAGECVLPVQYLGKKYIPSFRSVGIDGNGAKTYVIATEDNTTVNIQSWAANGVPFITSRTLNAGETFMWSMSSRNCNGDNPEDDVNCSTVNGSVIESDKPIAVMCNTDCSNMGECGACDMMMNQLLPEENWSNEYVTGQPIARLSTTAGATCLPDNPSSGDYIEISGKIGTNVTITDKEGTRNLVIPAPNYPASFNGDYGYGYIFTQVEPDAGILAQDPGSAFTEITADQNIQVVQYSKGWQTDNQNFADPECITVLPTKYWADSYLFGTILTGLLTTTECLIITKTAETGSILFNGNALNNWNQMVNTDYSYSRNTTIATGTNSVISTTGASIGLYGTARAQADSYGLVGGQAPLVEVTGCPDCPVVDFDFTPQCPGSPVQFTDQSVAGVSNIGEWEWDFGDNSPKEVYTTSTNPTHTYVNSGTYLVTLQLTTTEDPPCIIEKQFTITIPDVPEVDAGDDVEICPGVSINLGGNPAVDGGTGNFTISWTSNEGFTSSSENPSIQPTTTDTYTISVVDNGSGCTAEDEVTITVKDDYVVTDNVTEILCFGETNGAIDIDITPAGTYTFTWSDGNTDQNRANLGAGIYTLTITAQDACDGIFTYNLQQPQQLVITADEVQPASCSGADGQAQANVTGGTTPYTFNWENGLNGRGEDFNNTLSSGTFGVTVTDDNGCTAETSVEINSSVNLDAELTGVNVLCFGDASGEIEVVPIIGAQPFTVSTSAGTVNGNTISNLPAGDYTVNIQDANGCIIQRFITIEQPEAPLIFEEQEKVDIKCFGQSTGEIHLEVSGGTEPYDYDWSPNGPNKKDNTGLSQGTYNYTVTDDNGCTITGVQNIVEPSELLASGNGTDLACFGDNSGSITTTVSGGTPISASNPYVYTWSGGATGPNPTGLAAGPYNLTVTDKNGCTKRLSFNLLEPNEIVIDLSATEENCKGADGTITANVSGGAGDPYTYRWSNNATTKDLTGLSTNDYTITVTDAQGCTETATANVGRDNGTISVRQIAASQPECKLPNGSITVSAANGLDPYTFEWSNSASGATVQNIGPGQYTVTASDANQCEATLDIQLNSTGSITASITPTPVKCFNGTDGSATASSPDGQPPLNFSWSHDSTVTSATANNLPSGSYSVTVEDNRGCEAVEFTFISNQAEINAVLAKQDALCADSSSGKAWIQSITGGVAPYAYAWSNGTPGATPDSTINIPEGNTSVVVTDANNCTNSFNIQIDEPLPITIVYDQDSVSCKDGSDGKFWVTASGGTTPYSYDWGDPAIPMTADTIRNLKAGTYGMIVRDANGCVNQGNFGEVFEPEIGIEVAFNIIKPATCNGDTDGGAQATAINYQGQQSDLQFLWSNGNTTDLISGVGAGIYSVTVTDANGCSADSTIAINEPFPFQITSVDITDERCLNKQGRIEVSAIGDPAFNVQYHWTDDDTYNSVLDQLSQGTYTLRIFDANSPCDTTVMYYVDRYGDIEFEIEEVEQVYCPGGANAKLEARFVSADEVKSVNYLWSNGRTSEVILNLSAGTYNLTVEDVDGCTSVSEYTLVDPLPMVIDFNAIDPTCFEYSDGIINASVTNGQAPFTYEWSNGGFGETINDLPQGLYSVLVTDDFKCTMSAEVQITHPEEIVLDLPETITAAKGIFPIVRSTISPSDNYTYYWYPEEMVRVNGLFQTNVIVEDTSMIYLRAENGAGCFDIDSVLVNFLPFVDVKIPNVIVYGDPENGIFKMRDDEYLAQFNMKVFNRWGEKVFESNNVNNGWNGTQDGEPAEVGVYMYVINFEDIKGEKRVFGGNVSLLH